MPSPNETELFICSSRRHLYMAAGLALSSARESHLLFVDQKQPEQDPIIEAIKQQDGVFAQIHLLAKHKRRKDFRRILKSCQELVTQLRPSRIYVGNDRKFQFQYAMKIARELNLPCRGVYMDDGTGTYESGIYLHFWPALWDRTLIKLAKWISVGFWYQRARYFGGSRWVDELIVQHPKLLPEPVQASKDCQQLPAAAFKQTENLQQLEQCFLHKGIDTQSWMDCDGIVVLPLYKTLIKNTATSAQQLNAFMQQLRQASADCQKLGIKYHPRETKEYFAPRDQDVLIDRDIPAEILFSKCQAKCIVGDTSSALLSAQWLQTEARVLSLCPEHHSDHPLSRLLANAGIEISYF